MSVKLTNGHFGLLNPWQYAKNQEDLQNVGEHLQIILYQGIKTRSFLV